MIYNDKSIKNKIKMVKLTGWVYQFIVQNKSRIIHHTFLAKGLIFKH